MAQISNYIVPGILAFITLYGLLHEVPVFDAFVSGARSGIGVAFRILPSLVALTTGVGMLRASGALDVFSYALSPLAQLLSLPVEVIPLALLRPISGSSAMVIFQDLLANFGPDSYVGRVASTMMGSTETTFYTIAIYFGASKITNTRHVLPAALTADLVGFIMSAWVVRTLLP